MLTRSYFQVSSFIFLFLTLSACQSGSALTVPHNVEEFVFSSGPFKLVGELRSPLGHQPHPLIIMVHGDGPASRRYFASIKNCFLNAGYATLMWDKPGSGDSRGSFTSEKLRAERAQILLSAIEECKRDPRIESHSIGVWGISQAGYVVPMALTQTDYISFMILVGVAGENGIEQTAYFVSQQIRCEGFTADQAAEAEALAASVCGARSYEEYVQHGEILLSKYPIVKDLDFMAGILPRDRWQAADIQGEAYFNPIQIIEQTTIPTLVFLGEKDKNVNPIQATAAYKIALKKAGNPDYAVHLIPGTDHNIILCETGCEKERRNRSRVDWSRYSPQYLDTMRTWLLKLKQQQ